ncbi:MAG: PIN domain-containing protein, partial [Bacteroidetes bacterium]
YVQETNRDILKKALRSDFNDFEDAIQYYSAIQLGEIDIITTRNLKDFKKSEIPVLSPSTTNKLLLKDM